MSKQISLSRRNFLKTTSVAAAGLAIGVSLPLGKSNAAAPSPLEPNAFIEITPLGETKFIVPNSEMGQGVEFGLTTLVAEELNIQPSLIKTEFAPFDSAYAMPSMGIQVTGGSASIRERFIQLREAAATTRELLLLAAAQQLQTSKNSLSLQDGEVHHNGQKYSVGEFVETAKTVEIPAEVALTPSSEFKWIGKDRGPRMDALAKVTGTARFGMDVMLPNTKVAAVLTSPVLGGSVKSFDASIAKQRPGVLHVVEVYNGIAVVAETYWQARQALPTLKVEWNTTDLVNHSSNDITKMLEQGLEEDGTEAYSSGSIDNAMDQADQVHQARYYVPFLSHTTMEPMNCVVKIDSDQMDVWIGTQAPDLAAQLASEYSSIDRDKITIHTEYLGGGFGRRALHDYLGQAVQIAEATNLPIKLIWSRENDQQNDAYRPASMADMQASLDQNGAVTGWSVKRAGPNIMPYMLDEGLGLFLPQFLSNDTVDWLSKLPFKAFDDLVVDQTSVEGFHEDYAIANKEVRHVTVDPGLRVGAWRSVGHTFTAFFKESFMDELAHKAREDPVAFRLKHMGDNPRLANTLKLAAEKAGWGKAKPGRYLGIASQKSFESYVTEVAEISIEEGEPVLHKVTCVIDCGIAVNPDIVRAQMESGINDGLSAALYGEITLENGVVQETNFDTYELTRMNVSPEIEVHIVESNEAPTGVGEPGTPPLAPALANAIFAATGKRLRKLPFDFS